MQISDVITILLAMLAALGTVFMAIAGYFVLEFKEMRQSIDRLNDKLETYFVDHEKRITVLEEIK